MRIAVNLLACICFVIFQISAARQDKLDRKEGVSVFIYSPSKESRGSGLDTWIKNQQKSLKRLKRPIIRQTLDGRFVKDEVEGILLLTEEGSNEVFVPEELIVSTKKLLTFVQQQLKNNESFIDERNPVRRDTENSEGKPFSFQYIVDDELTQNFQTRQEEGDAMGVVKGCYQLLEPDGMVRTVIYQADSFGFKVVSASKGPDKVPCSGSSDEGFQTPFQKTFNQKFGGKALSSSNNRQVGNRPLPKTQQPQKQVQGGLKSFVPSSTVAVQKESQSSDIGSTPLSQKEDSIVSYINNLSETLFQSFKSVDSKDVSNYVNFPFVLIPISTFFQLRQDGHIDDEVQGFGAVIQNPQGKIVGSPKSLTQSRGHQTKTFDNTKTSAFNQNPSGTNNIKESYSAPEVLHQVSDKGVKSPNKLTQNFNRPSKNPQTLNYKEPLKPDIAHSIDDSQPSQSQNAASFSQNFNSFEISGINPPIKGSNRLTKPERKRPLHRNQESYVAQPDKKIFGSKVAVAPKPLPSIEKQTLQQPEIKQKLQQLTVDEGLALSNVDSSYSNYESDELYEDENFTGATEFTHPTHESTEPQVPTPNTDLNPTSINGFTVPAISILPLEYDHESSDLPFPDSIESFSDSAEVSDILDQHAISSVGTHQVVDPNNEYIPPTTDGPSFGEKISAEKFNNHLDNNNKKHTDSISSSATTKTREPQFSTATSNHELFPPEIPESDISDSNSFQLYQTPTKVFQETDSIHHQNHSTIPTIPTKNINEIQPNQPVIPKEKPFDFENEQSLTQLYQSPAPITTTSTDSLSQKNKNAFSNLSPSSLDSTPSLSTQSHEIAEQHSFQLLDSYHHGSNKLKQGLQQSLNRPNPVGNQNINLSNKNGYQPSKFPAQVGQSTQIPNVNVFSSFQSPQKSLTRSLLVSNKNNYTNVPKSKESVAEIYLVSPQFPNNQGQSSSYKNVPSQGVTPITLNSNEKASQFQKSFKESSIPGSKQTNKFYEAPKQNFQQANSATYQSKRPLITENTVKIRKTISSQKNGNNQLSQSDLTQLYQAPGQTSTLSNQPLQQLDQSTLGATHSSHQSDLSQLYQAPSQTSALSNQRLQQVDQSMPGATHSLHQSDLSQLYQAPSQTSALSNQRLQQVDQSMPGATHSLPQSDLTQLYQAPSQTSALSNQPLQQVDQSKHGVTHSSSQSFHPANYATSHNLDNKNPSANVVLMKPIIKQLYQAPSEAGTQTLQTSSQSQSANISLFHRDQIQSSHANVDLPNLSLKDVSSYSSQITFNPTFLEQPGSQNLPQSSQKYKFDGGPQASPQNIKPLNQATTQNFGHSLKSSVKNQFQVEDPGKSSNQALKNANQSPSTDYQAPSVTKLWPTNQTFPPNQKMRSQASNLHNQRQPLAFQHQSSKQSQTPSFEIKQKESFQPKMYRAPPRQSQIQTIPVPKHSSQVSKLNHPTFHNFQQRPDEVQTIQNHKQSRTQVFPTQNKFINNESVQTFKQSLQQPIKTVSQNFQSGQAQSFRTPKQSPGHYQATSHNSPQKLQTPLHNLKPSQTTQQSPSQAPQYSNQFQSQLSVTSKQSLVQSFQRPMQGQNKNQKQNQPQSVQTPKQVSHQLQSFPTSKQTQIQSLPDPKPNPVQSYVSSKQINQQQFQFQSTKQTQKQSNSFPSRLQSSNQAPIQKPSQYNQLPLKQTSNNVNKPLSAGEISRKTPTKANIPNPQIQNSNSNPKNSPDQFPEFGLKISNSGSNSPQQTSSYSSIPKATSKSMKGWSPMTSGMMY